MNRKPLGIVNPDCVGQSTRGVRLVRRQMHATGRETSRRERVFHNPKGSVDRSASKGDRWGTKAPDLSVLILSMLRSRESEKEYPLRVADRD